MTTTVAAGTDPRAAERLARAHMSRVVEPGDRTLGRLAAVHGYPGVVSLLRDGEVPDRWLVRARSLGPSTSDVVAGARRRGIRVVVPGDPEWPDGLDDLQHTDLGAVSCLWVRGRLAADVDAPSVPWRAMAVVGSRDASTYGESVAGSLAADLAGAGWTVASGAALGIDAAAHRGALAVTDGGPADGAAIAGAGAARPIRTVAVLGCGVDRPYPARHAGLLDNIAASGAVVAELPPGSEPYPWRFPARNRIIAAMASGVVVVEAGLRSGAIGTARAADALSRPVMAVPGPVHSRRSTGCHRMVRDGATLVTGMREVLETVGPIDGGHPDEESIGDARADRVLRCLSRTRERTVDEVAAMAGLDPGEVRSVLLDLEITSATIRGVGGWRRAAAGSGSSLRV